MSAEAQDHVHAPTDHEELARRWAELLAEHPKLRIRAAAEALGTGEAQLLATQVGDGVTRLRCEPRELFEALPELGEIMASTRNEWAVIEKTGTYDNVDIWEHMGVVLDEEIDLRLFLSHYHSVFAVRKPVEGTERVLRSIQFFAKDGTSLHKVYAKKTKQAEAFEALVARFAHEDQTPGEPWIAVDPKPEERPDEEIDVAGFQQEWRDLEDTHHFFGMLRRYDVRRTQALRLAPEGFTERLDLDAVRVMLDAASAEEVPIMVFVGSPGCIEIHTGPVRKIAEMGSWINVLDPRFNLHLQRDGVAEAWVVRKPTVDGIVTAVECFDADGGVVIMFFGKRKPGIPEDERWRDLVAKLPRA
ncbi:MAG: ChuX/HutX family heme-like substrate-binding protein [Myxococcota bacterium]